MKKSVVTIRDVSAKCGLSISTVSKALNNYADVSLETRQLVQRTAQEIGYHPNAIARTLKTNRSYNLGVLFEEESGQGLTHSFFAAILNAFRSACTARGYDITFINHHAGNTGGMSYLDHCRYRNVDGICIVCATFDDPEVSELARSGLPCVTIDHVYDGVSCVLNDNASGVRQLVDHAVAQGHRDIAFVYGHPSDVTQKRISAYRQAMSDHGLAVRPEYLVESVYILPSAGYDATLQLMRLPHPPTCILMPDDNTSLGAQKALEELSLTVPGDVSLAGYDGIQLTQMLKPRLTTIWQDTQSVGAQAANILVNLIESPEPSAPVVEVIPVRMLEGETFGPAKA